MPSQEENEAKLRSALMVRFFPHTPRQDSPSRTNWNDEQHTQNRLSRALAAYTIVCKTNIEDSLAVESVVDGSNDSGIDAIYYDKASSRLLVVQVKYKAGGASPSQDETLKAINGLRNLRDKKVDCFNESIKCKFDLIEEALDTPGVVIYLIMACLGEQLNTHACTVLDSYKDELDGLMEWEFCKLSSLCQHLLDEQTIDSVTVKLTLENAAKVTSPRMAIYGQAKAQELANLVQEHGAKLFQRNVRHYLGSVAVNTSIQQTVQRRPEELFYLNNGITALTTRIIPSASGRTYTLEGFSIVNGAQTVGSFSIVQNLSPDAKVMMTVIQVTQGDADVGTQITKARNYQNVIRGIDFVGLDPRQERLRKEFASINITYHYRPSAEAVVASQRSIKVEEAALALACMSFKLYSSSELAQHQSRGQRVDNGVDYVTAAKKEISRIWEPEGSFYSRLFTDTLHGIRLCRIVVIYRFLDQLLSESEATESDLYNRKMFFRHARFFVMATVAHHCPALMSKLEHTLSDTDRTDLSRMTNELAELIYAVAENLRGSEGYLYLFRHMGLCQELADKVLAKLPPQNTLPSQTTVGAQAPLSPVVPQDGIG